MGHLLVMHTDTAYSDRCAVPGVTGDGTDTHPVSFLLKHHLLQGRFGKHTSISFNALFQVLPTLHLQPVE
jgi:hypothetical protein